MSEPNSSTEPSRVSQSSDLPVAVIAIHGVGRHSPGASAEAVITLLESAGRDSRVNLPSGDSFTGFVSHPIDIPLQPVPCPQRTVLSARARETVVSANFRASQDATRLQKIWRMFDERRGFIADRRLASARTVPPPTDHGQYSYEFMRTQVAGFQGSVDRSFSTFRMEGQRISNGQSTKVHFYDAHYADLKKTENSIVAFFFAFYQLLFHLGSLSLLCVYWAEAENVACARDKKLWRVLASVHAASVRFLVLGLPILNLILLVLSASAFVNKLDASARHSNTAIPAVLFSALLGLGAVFVFGKSRKSPRNSFLWSTIPLFAAAAVPAVMFFVAQAILKLFFPEFQNPWQFVTLICWIVLGGLLLYSIASKYEPLRPGAISVTVVLYSFNAIAFLFFLWEARYFPGSEIATAAFWTLQFVFAQLAVCWILCLVCALASCVLSMVCVAREKDSGQKARAIAALRTARFAFAVPASLFLVATLSLWSGVNSLAEGRWHAFGRVSAEALLNNPATPLIQFAVPDPEQAQSWFRNFTEPESNPQMRSGYARRDKSTENALIQIPEVNVIHYLESLLLISVTPGLPIILSVMIFTLFLLVWMALPSFLYEMSPEKTIGTKNRAARFLGLWLSRGLDNVAILTRLLWSAIVLLPIVFGVLAWLAWHKIDNPFLNSFLWTLSAISHGLINWTGAILAVSGLAILTGFFKYGAAILDTLLDVDNYLRTSPVEETPRAQIAERFTSLLRSIGSPDENGKARYTKLIIVAHSLGSMVTTDLLRFLKKSCEDPQVQEPLLRAFGFGNKNCEAQIPIFLVTMGSPLRQLLNRFFPHLYWWVGDVPENTLRSLGEPLAPPIPEISQNALPDPSDLCVREWHNVYRSGDYVGRSLWIGHWLDGNENGDEASASPPKTAVQPNSRARSEVCLGLGAHTHYWDRSAGEVSRLLNELI